MAERKKSKVKTTAKGPTEYSLAERLKFLREARGYTQKQLADMAGLSQATVAHIEKATKDPSVDTLSKLADALDTHIATLFAFEDIFVFDMKRLRRKYNHVDKLTPHLYTALSKVVQYAKDVGLIR